LIYQTWETFSIAFNMTNLKSVNWAIYTTGCVISSVTLVKTLVAPLYEVVESSRHTASHKYCVKSTKTYFF
jgi:hypothetical protein